MFNAPVSREQSVALVGYVSFFATFIGQGLVQEQAIAQPISADGVPAPLPALSFEFSPPTPQGLVNRSRSEKAMGMGDRSDVPLRQNTKDTLALLDFTFPAPIAIPHDGTTNRRTWPDRSPTAERPVVPFPSGEPRPALPLDILFSGHSDSLVARAIGGAEGTRSPDGGKTWAYKGHTDPGNGVWNLGTFSWQHGASSPEEADRKQLARLRKQAIALNQKAAEAGIPWGLEEQLNALDLANQSPSAALNPGGYIDRLKEAQAEGLKGSDAILWARTWSYRHPSGTRWNAPGLGNTHQGIRTDQKRRQDAIKAAIAHFSF